MTFHWRPSRRRPGIGRPLFDDAVMLLEDRIMLDAVPVVSVTPPDHVFLTNPANSFQVTLTFSNTGSQAGYGPYVEVFVPKNGADGGANPANADGSTFVKATYLGQPVTVAANLTFDTAGHATNPLTGDPVNGTPGDGLVVLQLPFGSFTGPQTPAALIATFAQSPLGNVGVPLTIAARGGFQFGLDPLDNPATDPHLVGATAATTYTPSVAILTKTSDAPANTQEETATGPNNDHFYTLNLDVAQGQTLTNAIISDALPDSVVYLGATVTGGTGVITHQPVIGSVVNPADNILSVRFASLTGAAGTADAVVRVHFYVNDTHFNGTPVVNPTSGANTTTVNDASLTATFKPIDTIDPAVTFTQHATSVDTIVDKPIALQKSSAIAIDTGPAGLNSGDTVAYTLTLQVSDYFSIGNLSLTDVLGDGQRLDTTFIPTIAVTQRGITSATAALAGVTVGAPAPGDVTTGSEFAGTFVSVFDRTTGVTTSKIDVSTAVGLGGIDADGVIAGGRTQAGDAAVFTGGTTITITFRAVVQNNFENDAVPIAIRGVHQGDTVGNTATVAGSIRNNLLPAFVVDATATRDDAATSLTLPKGGVAKTIYAINGDTNLGDFTVGGKLSITATDLITYRLVYNLPVTSFQGLTLTDFLPLPVLNAQALALSATPFTVGTFAYGPTDTLHLRPDAPTPAETFDTTGNSVKFAYPDYSIQNSGTTSVASKIDLLFTLPVKDTTFADGLFLTNLITSREENTPGAATTSNSIVGFNLGQPRLLVQKAYVTASSGTITSPETIAGLSFLAPGTSGRGYTLTAPLTDAVLGATATAKTAAPSLNSNVTGLDGGDTARVALVVNNQGSGANGAFGVVLDDTLAPGTSFLGGSLATANLVVTRGDGTIFTAGTDYTVTPTATGLSIHFVDGTTGRIEKNGGVTTGGANDGGDIILVTYDVRVDPGVTISPSALTSNATISAYTAVAGGLNQVGAVPPTEGATIGLLAPAVVKTLISTSETAGGNLSIGETATYRVTYTFAEGSQPSVRLLDILPTGTSGSYTFVSSSIVAIGGNLTTDGTTPVTAAYFGAAVVSAGGSVATFGGAGKTVVDVADNVVDAKDTIVVDYVVRAVNTPTNVTGLNGFNTGRLTYGANNQVNATSPIGIALPDLTIAKAFVPNGNPTPNAGDPVTFTITVANPGTVTGYSLDLSDPLPAGLTGLSVTSVTGAGGLTPADFSRAGDTLTLDKHINLLGGQSFTVTIGATVATTVSPGSTLTNVASFDFATFAGGPSPNIRVVAKSSSVPLTIAPNTIAKTIFTTSVGGDTSDKVDVGELVSFDLATTLTEGPTKSLTIGDVLPPGLVFVSGSIVSVGANISGATLAPGVTFPGGVPTFAFGDVTDLVDNTPQTAADQIVVRIQARVADVAANTSGKVLTDIATISSLVGGTTQTQTAPLPVTVTVPDVIVVKALTTTGPIDAGDTVTFTINVRHAADSTATAYGLALGDALPAGLTGLAVVGVNNDPTGGGANGLALTTASFTTAGNTLALATPVDLALNQSFTVTISARVGDGAIAGGTIVNAASLGYSTVPGVETFGRTLASTSSAPLTTTAFQDLTKVITATDDPLTGSGQFRPGVIDLAIGETATVALTATFEQGTTPNVVIVDRLPVNATPGVSGATFGFVGAPVLTLGAGVTFTGSGTGVLSDTNGDGIADTITYTLGSVTVPGTSGAGTGTATITYRTTPLDRPENAAGDMLASGATLTSGLGTVSRSVDYDLVAPNVVLTKTVATPGTPRAGDTVAYTITLTNTGSGPAGDLALVDVAAPGVGSIGPATLTVGGVATVFASPDAVTLAALDAGQTATVTYSAVVADSAVAGTAQANTATASFDSHAGPGGRPGTASGTATFVTAATQAFTKAIVATTVASTGDAQVRPGVTDLVIGEQATIELVATFSPGTTNGVVISDRLPTVPTGDVSSAGTLAFAAGTPLVTIGGVTVTLLPGQIIRTDTNGDGVLDTISFDLGTVVIPAGAADGTVRIRYDVLAPDLAVNAAGDQLTSRATLTSAIGTAAASVDIDLVQPALTITTATSVAVVKPGDVVTYTITVANPAGGTAQAEDVVVADLLASGQLTLLSGSVTTSQGSVTAGNGAGDTTLGVAVGSIALGSPPVTITFQAVVGAVAPASIVDTVASVTYDGVPGAVAGQPGRPATASADVPVGVVGFAKAITATSLPETGTAQYRPSASDLAIGETATFTLTVTLPAGTTPLSLTDLLGDANGQLELVGTPTLATSAGVVAGLLTTTRPDVNGDGVPDLGFALGPVTAPAGGGTVTITYTARVGDVPRNVAGDLLDLPAVLNYGPGTLADTRALDLVAPVVTLAKAVATAGTPNAGDTVTYTLTAANTGTGPAYDLTLTDTLPAGVTAVAGSGRLTVGGVTTSVDATTVPLALLDAGQTAVLTFDAVLGDASLTGAALTNSASIAFDSLAGPGGRTGTAAANATFTTAATQSLSKVVTATDDPLTGSGQFRADVPDLAIGETATVAVTATFEQGTTANVVIVDHLPINVGAAGTSATFGFVGVPVLTPGPGVTFTGSSIGVLSDTNGDGVADTVTYTLGSVTVPGAPGAGTGSVTISYGTTPLDRPENAAGDALNAAATLTSSLGTAAASVDFDIVAPNLQVTKAISPAGTVFAAGQTFNYVITLDNIGSGPAADITVNELLPPGVVEMGPPLLSIDGGPSRQFFYGYNPFAPITLSAGSHAEITFIASVTNAAVTGSTQTNVATANYDSHEGPGGRPGVGRGSVDFTVLGSQVLTKTITATDDPLTGDAAFRPGVTDLGIGETAGIRLVATLAQGTTANVVITDHLPAGAGGTLGFGSTPVLTLPAGATFTGSLVPVLTDTNGDGIADTVTYTLGTVTLPAVPGGGTSDIAVTYTATVLDRPENVAGAALVSPAALTSAIGVSTASIGFDVVAPNVVVTKAVASAGTPDAGNTVTYTITLTNSGSGPAGDLGLADVAAPGIRDIGPATLTVDGTSTVFASPSAVTLASLAAGQSATVTYGAVVADSAVAGAPESNTATATFDSHAGPGGRPGSASGSATFVTAATQALAKAVIATSQPFTGSGQFRPDAPDLTIGEVATFELRATLSEGTTNDVVITDTLQVPGGTLVLTGTPVIVFGNGTTAPFTGSIVQVDTNGDGIPDTVRFVLGTVTIPGDNDPANNTVAIRYQAVVSDRPENVGGDQLTLPATLTSSSGASAAATGVDLVAPVLTVTKTLDPVQPAGGASIVYLLTVGHAANSSAAATNVVLADVLPAGALLSGIPVIVGGPAGASVTGTTVTTPLLALGETLVARFTIVSDTAHPAAEGAVNRAVATFGSLPEGGRGGSATASAVIPSVNIVSTIRFAHEPVGAFDDRRYVSPLLPIEPIYSGEATPGSFVELTVTDETGSITGFGGSTTDTGGNWLIRMPSATVTRLLHDSTLDEYYASTRLFSAPNTSLFATRDLFGSARNVGRIDVGSVPAFGTQVVHYTVTQGAGILPDHAPTWRNQVFVATPGLDVEQVVDNAAGRSIERLYGELAAPEAAALNRFNRAFLSAADL